MNNNFIQIMGLKICKKCLHANDQCWCPVIDVKDCYCPLCRKMFCYCEVALELHEEATILQEEAKRKFQLAADLYLRQRVPPWSTFIPTGGKAPKIVKSSIQLRAFKPYKVERPMEKQ